MNLKKKKKTSSSSQNLKNTTQSKSQKAFSIEGQKVNTLSSVGYKVSVATT